jgi:large subunit ribosomal protein L15
MKLHQIPKRNNRTFKAKRIGRGYGSGKGGHTVGRGQKGQSSRSGGAKGKGFEGGNRPLYLRLPKFRGFRNPNRVVYQPVNLSDIEKHYENGDVVSLKTLREKGMVRKGGVLVKVLAKGKLTKKVTLSADIKVSKAASAVIERKTDKAKK